MTKLKHLVLNLQRELFPYGFFFVFVVKSDDYECTGTRELPPTTRSKTVEFIIKEKVNYIFMKIHLLLY